MPLQGKLSVGLLLEDNPYKSYFLFKPLFVWEEGSFAPFSDAEKIYPENGSIRIVPDKNEMNTFKTRMRQIGCLCMMDLRRFPSENNKIRLNKNYSREMGEKNQFIVYSDVLAELKRGEFFELIEAEDALDEMTVLMKAPIAQLIAVRAGGRIFGPYQAQPGEEGAFELNKCEGAFSLPMEEAASSLMEIDVGDGDMRVLLGMLSEDEASAQSVKAAPVRTEDGEEKPWITRDESIAPAQQRGFLSSRDQFIAAQSGINPRRGRSLSEVIDDQWRKSRIDQLGHPIPQAAGRPAVNPVERAISAVEEAWHIREARAGILNHLVGMQDMHDALKKYFAGGEKSAEAAAFEAALNEFEASRLKLAMEIDEMRAARDALYEKLMVELRKRNADEVAGLDREKQRIRAELDAIKAEASAAEARVAGAEKALTELFGERFDEHIARKIFEDKAVLGLSGGDQEAEVTGGANVLSIEKDALIERAWAALSGAGYIFSRVEVINLLILLSLDAPIILSGAPGAGHESLADVLARALGICGAIASIPAVNAPTEALTLEEIERLSDGARVFLIANDAPEGAPLGRRMLNAAYFVRLGLPPASSPWRDAALPEASQERLSIEAIAKNFEPLKEVPAQVDIKLLEVRSALSSAGYLMGREMLSGLYRYCAVGCAHLPVSPIEVLDFALTQRALPAIMASMEPKVLRALPSIFGTMSRCKALMNEQLPVF